MNLLSPHPLPCSQAPRLSAPWTLFPSFLVDGHTLLSDPIRDPIRDLNVEGRRGETVGSAHPYEVGQVSLDLLSTDVFNQTWEI